MRLLLHARFVVAEVNVIDAIHALEEMEDYEVSDEITLPKVKYYTCCVGLAARLS